MLLSVPCTLLLLFGTVVLELKYLKSDLERACAKSTEASRLRNRLVQIIADGGDKKKDA